MEAKADYLQMNVYLDLQQQKANKDYTNSVMEEIKDWYNSGRMEALEERASKTYKEQYGYKDTSALIGDKND